MTLHRNKIDFTRNVKCTDANNLSSFNAVILLENLHIENRDVFKARMLFISYMCYLNLSNSDVQMKRINSLSSILLYF